MRIGHLSVAVVLAVAACGCSLKGWLHVFNNSSESVVFETRDGKHRIAAAQTTKFRYTDDVIVTMNGSASRYAVAALPPDGGYFYGGLTGPHVMLQLEADGKLFILRAYEKPPISASTYGQPPGFPLLPMSEKAPGARPAAW